MTTEEAYSYIHSLDRFGSKPGLERITALLKILGDPQKDIKAIHVAGTNGKGSTSTMISNILIAEGYKTGLYISPFVVKFNERIQINGEMITDGEIALYTETVKKASLSLDPSLGDVTEFEFITALAFKFYADSGCDAVVLEVGLGGRLDATNVIEKPLCSVIARIDLDHTAILGDTIEKIAYEKCGIIKNGCPVVTFAENPPKALEVIKSVAKERNARLTVTGEGVKLLFADETGSRFTFCGEEYKVSLPGLHQVQNALNAIAAVKNAFPMVSTESIKKGLASSTFAARCEVISSDPFCLLDGSHNPNGTAALNEFLNSAGVYEAVAIVGFMADKDVSVAVKNVSAHFSKAYTVTVKANKRTMDANALASLINSQGVPAESCTDYAEAIEKAAASGKKIVVFGSLYLSSDIRPLLLSRFKTK